MPESVEPVRLTVFVIPISFVSKLATAVRITFSPDTFAGRVRLLVAIVAVVLPSYTLLEAVKVPLTVSSFFVISAVVVGAPANDRE